MERERDLVVVSGILELLSLARRARAGRPKSLLPRPRPETRDPRPETETETEAEAEAETETETETEG